MQRRTFFKALLTLPALALPRKASAGRPEGAQAPPPIEGVYSDSQNTPLAQLRALYDGERAAGGITYQP